jgi:hypothetical protein
MPTNYTGNPTAVEAPAVAPGPNIAPVLALPVDTDVANSASIYQPFKTLADYQAYLYQNWFPNKPMLTNDLPQWRFTDAAGNNRFLIDHVGFPAGRLAQFREDWQTTMSNYTTTQAVISENRKWQYFAVGAAQVGSNNPDAINPVAHLDIAITTPPAPTAIGYLSTSKPLLNTVFTNQSVVLETEVGGSFLPGSTFYFGFSAGQNPTTDTSYIRLRTSSSSWVAETAAGGTPSSTSLAKGLPGIWTADSRIRIEIHGSSSPYAVASSNTVRFYVGDVMLQQITGTSIPTIPLYLGFGVSSTTYGSPIPTIIVSPITVFWNRWANPPGL